jgi:hypothetical protein
MTTWTAACRRSAGWLSALILLCAASACGANQRDSADASKSEHTPAVDAGSARDGSNVGDDGGTNRADAGASGAAGSGRPDAGVSQSDAGGVVSDRDAGQPTQDCQRAQSDSIAADLSDTTDLSGLIDALLDKLERAETVPYCSQH